MAVTHGRLRARTGPRPGGRLVFLALISLLFLSLTFLFGFFLGHQWGQSQPREARSEKGRQAPRAEARGITDQLGGLPHIQERLTFYHALTAPPPPPSKASDGMAAPREPEKEPRTPAPSGVAVGSQSGSSALRSGASVQAQSWTIQVGAYRNRTQAAALQRSLAAAGHDAYLTTVTGQDGVAHYRVRIGSYPTRAEAEKVAERLRAERSLTPLILPW